MRLFHALCATLGALLITSTVVFGAHVVPGGEPLGQLGEAGLDRPEPCAGAVEDVADGHGTARSGESRIRFEPMRLSGRSGRLGWRMASRRLRTVRSGIAREVHGARVGGQFADGQSQNGGFARPVRADDAEPLARRAGEGQVGDERRGREAEIDAREGDDRHGNPLIERCTGRWDTGQSDMGPSYPGRRSSVDMRVRAPRLWNSTSPLLSRRSPVRRRRCLRDPTRPVLPVDAETATMPRDSVASAKSDRRMTPGRSPPVSHA